MREPGCAVGGGPPARRPRRELRSVRRLEARPGSAAQGRRSRACVPSAPPASFTPAVLARLCLTSKPGQAPPPTGAAAWSARLLCVQHFRMQFPCDYFSI